MVTSSYVLVFFAFENKCGCLDFNDPFFSGLQFSQTQPGEAPEAFYFEIMKGSQEAAAEGSLCPSHGFLTATSCQR